MSVLNLRSRVYCITDQDTQQGERLRATVGAALRAGVGMIQYRAKNLSTRDMVAEATALVRMTRGANVPLVINDRVDVALAVGADGVHVGAEDMPVAYARRMMGPAAIIGATTPTPQDARIAETDGASYVAVGAVYSSPTKPEKLVLGLEGLDRVRSATSLPVCAIGGIDRERAAELAGSGVELIAVMSAVHGEGDTFANAQALVKALAKFPAPGRAIAP